MRPSNINQQIQLVRRLEEELKEYPEDKSIADKIAFHYRTIKEVYTLQQDTLDKIIMTIDPRVRVYKELRKTQSNRTRSAANHHFIVGKINIPFLFEQFLTVNWKQSILPVTFILPEQLEKKSHHPLFKDIKSLQLEAYHTRRPENYSLLSPDIPYLFENKHLELLKNIDNLLKLSCFGNNNFDKAGLKSLLQHHNSLTSLEMICQIPYFSNYQEDKDLSASNLLQWCNHKTLKEFTFTDNCNDVFWSILPSFKFLEKLDISTFTPDQEVLQGEEQTKALESLWHLKKVSLPFISRETAQQLSVHPKLEYINTRLSTETAEILLQYPQVSKLKHLNVTLVENQSQQLVNTISQFTPLESLFIKPGNEVDIDDSLKTLSTLPNLRTLEIVFDGFLINPDSTLTIESSENLSKLTQLTRLKIHNISYGENKMLNNLSPLINLKELSLVEYGNQVISVGELKTISHLQHLEKLELSLNEKPETPVCLEALNTLKKLRYLQIINTPYPVNYEITGILKNYFPFSSLVHLALLNFLEFSHHALEAIADQKNLKFLNFSIDRGAHHYKRSRPEFSNEKLKILSKLKQLEYLDLRSFILDEKFWKIIAQFPSLKWFRFSKIGNNESIQMLKQARPDIQLIYK